MWKYFSNQRSPISGTTTISGRLPEFPPLHQLSLHPHTKPVATVLRKVHEQNMWRVRGSRYKSNTSLTICSNMVQTMEACSVCWVLFCSVHHFHGPPTCLLSVRTCHVLHMSVLVTKTQSTALMDHSLLHLTFLASYLNGHSESKAFRAEGQTQDFRKCNEQRSTAPHALLIQQRRTNYR